MFLLQVSVGHIVPGGSADIDGRLRTGDEIMYVDSHCVLNASHHKVVQLMGNAAINGRVSLRIRRRLLTTSASVTGQSMPGNHYSVTFCFTLFARSVFVVTFLLSYQNLSFQLNQHVISSAIFIQPFKLLLLSWLIIHTVFVFPKADIVLEQIKENA